MQNDPRKPPAIRPADAHAGQAALLPELDRLDRIAHRMDLLFRIPGIGVRIGLDAILGLIPGIGDAAALVPAVYLLHRAHGMGAPRALLARMAANIAMDALIGAVPLLGDLFDIGFKANIRNMRLLRAHFAAGMAGNKTGPRGATGGP